MHEKNWRMRRKLRGTSSSCETWGGPSFPRRRYQGERQRQRALCSKTAFHDQVWQLGSRVAKTMAASVKAFRGCRHCRHQELSERKRDGEGETVPILGHRFADNWIRELLHSSNFRTTIRWLVLCSVGWVSRAPVARHAGITPLEKVQSRLKDVWLRCSAPQGGNSIGFFTA